MESKSWVIVDRSTGRPVWETWSPRVVANVRRQNTHDVVPIVEWLARVRAEAAAHFAAARAARREGGKS
jgi:hypothetical protein